MSGSSGGGACGGSNSRALKSGRPVEEIFRESRFQDTFLQLDVVESKAAALERAERHLQRELIVILLQLLMVI